MPSSIMSVREMIDLAFGYPDVNIVNHKIIQTVLHLLARQLRLLERRVKVEIGQVSKIPETTLSITEIKMHAMQEKDKKGIEGALDAGSTDTSQEEQKRKSVSSVGTKSALKVAGGVRKEDLEAGAARDSLTSVEKNLVSNRKFTKKSITKKRNTGAVSTERSLASITSLGDKSKASVAEKTIPKDPRKIMDIVEETREKELRVIHQRADSKEVHEGSPIPMASLDSVEAQYEKLLVVEKVPAEEAKAIMGRDRDRTPRLSVVTQEEFTELAKVVRELQILFAPIAPPGFPENIQFLKDLRKGASLTDAMAAIQLSARLEAAEKTLIRLLGLVTELAIQTGIDLSKLPEGIDGNAFFGVTVEMPDGLEEPVTTSHKKSKKHKGRKEPTPPTPSEESVEVSEVEAPLPTVFQYMPDEEDGKEKPDVVTYPKMDAAMQELYEEIIKNVTAITTKTSVNVDNAFKAASRLEAKLEASLDLGDRMNDLETLVSNYAEQINTLDTSLSSQMTDYQEQLMQMQHDLETALETMAEVLANSGGDTTAVAELNAHFTSLQLDLDNMLDQQKDLKTMQSTFSYNLEALWKQIEHLRATKSDRDEVEDALRDKAGIGALNGLVSLEQFDAVRGDCEKRIGSAYDKFNNQEVVWQKAIDELLRELNEKADWIQLESLKEDIDKHLNLLKNKIHAMMEVLGEPHAATVTKKLHRDANCLSCNTPAHMKLEEPTLVPALPAFHASRPPTIGAEAPKPKDDGDHGFCYPGLPIPHPRDPRSHICHRYCGGSHTVINSTTLTRAPVGMIIRPVRGAVTTEIGSDGKTYVVDEEAHAPKPCLACNMPKNEAPQSSVAEQAPPIPVDNDSNMVPPDYRDYRELSVIMMSKEEKMSVTPPPPLDNDY